MLDIFYFGGPGWPGSSQQDLVCSGRAMLIYDAGRKARKTIDKEKIVKGHPRRVTPRQAPSVDSSFQGTQGGLSLVLLVFLVFLASPSGFWQWLWPGLASPDLRAKGRACGNGKDPLKPFIGHQSCSGSIPRPK